MSSVRAKDACALDLDRLGHGFVQILHPLKAHVRREFEESDDVLHAQVKKMYISASTRDSVRCARRRWKSEQFESRKFSRIWASFNAS
jgi:hypothetical protein